MKIFTITHKEFTPPPDSLYIPLQVGCAQSSQTYGYLRDDTGDNISYKNNLYGELTGLYWIWKNYNPDSADDKDNADIADYIDNTNSTDNSGYVGLVHYRRYFADDNGQLMNRDQFEKILLSHDIIVGKHIEYDISYEEKYGEYHNAEDLRKAGEVIKALYPDYYDTFNEVIHDNKQYVFNMFVTSKQILDAYASWLFDICFELEKYIDVSNYDKYRARIYGFLSEELLYVWIKKNNLFVYEAPVIYSQEKAETIEFKRKIKDIAVKEGYDSAYQTFLKMFKDRPDITLEDADFEQELRVILAQLKHGVEHADEACDKAYFNEQLVRMKHVNRIIGSIKETILQDNSKGNTVFKNYEHTGKENSYYEAEIKWMADNNITEAMLRTLMETDKSVKGFEERIISFIVGEEGKKFDTLMKEYRLKEPVSLVVLYYDISQDLDSAAQSISNNSAILSECIIADATGSLNKSDIKEQIFENVVLCDLSNREYDTVSQLKNDALKFTSFDKVIFLEAGQVIEKDFIEKLLNQGNILKSEAFKLLSENDDENLLPVIVSKEKLKVIGTFNDKLSNAQDYELLVRAWDNDCLDGFKFMFSEESIKGAFMESYFTYAYIIGKYTTKFKQSGDFERIFTKHYTKASNYGIQDFFAGNLETMIRQDKEFDEIDENTRPVLVIAGDNICYGVLNEFAYNFARALRNRGQCVRIFDIGKDSVEDLVKMPEKKFKAIVGFQTELYARQLGKGQLLGNIFKCPKFFCLFDHPLYVSYYLLVPVNDFYVLSQDADYAEYSKKYFPYVKDAWHFPPGGQKGSLIDAVHGDITCLNKEYGVSFIGTYNDYRERMVCIENYDKEDKHLALCLLNYMKHNVNLAVEDCFIKVLENEGITSIDDKTFVTKLNHFMDVVRTITFYYREKCVKTLLNAGITLHVFSDSWKKSRLSKYDNLIIHGDVSYKESLDVMAKSLISLNVMSWHKSGMTERIANAMLNGSVCVSDTTKYLSTHFTDGEDIVLYELDKLDELPGKIKVLLAEDNSETVGKIACAGFENASKNHTWEERAGQFLNIISNINS